MRIPAELAQTLALVVDEETLDAAAEALHITPSAVSQRIKALEQAVGQVVLVRSKPARATLAGEAVVRFARQLALLEHDARASLGLDEEAASLRVPLAVNADSLATWFLAPLARVAQKHPVVFDLHRDDQDFTAGLLETGTVMAAVTSREAPVAGCHVVALGSMRYRAYATPQFLDRWFVNGVDRDTLERAPVVYFDRRDELQTRWLRSRGADAAAPPRHHVPASADFATAIVLGMGWGLLPGFQADGPLARGELVDLGGEPVDVPLYWQQWNVRSPVIEMIAEEVISSGRGALAH